MRPHCWKMKYRVHNSVLLQSWWKSGWYDFFLCRPIFCSSLFMCFSANVVFLPEIPSAGNICIQIPIPSSVKTEYYPAQKTKQKTCSFHQASVQNYICKKHQKILIPIFYTKIIRVNRSNLQYTHNLLRQNTNVVTTDTG